MIIFEHLSYTYPDAPNPALQDVNLVLEAGEFILLVGPSGAGKSTLLRCLNGLVPHFSGGTLAGQITVNGLDPIQATPQILSRHVGFVFQDPEAQFVMDRVEDEIAFALENAALPPQEMRIRVEEVLDLLDLAPLRERPLETLSGGERQRVAIAAALALRPQILALDEPTSQLDPKSAEDVLQALVRLNNDLGLTIIMAEHRLERVLPFVDALVYLPDHASGIPDEALAVLAGAPDQILPQLPLVPPLVDLGRILQWQPLPLTIKAGRRFSRRWYEKYVSQANIKPRARPATQSSQTPYLQMRRVKVTYGRQLVVHNLDLDIWPGEIVVLMGRNGAGKTTVLKSLAGLIRPQQGTIKVANHDTAKWDVATVCQHIGYLPQDPNALLFAETVLDELLITLRNHGLEPAQARPNEAQADRAISPQALLARLGLAGKAGAYPRDLSAGERQRVALGAIMVTRPGGLLLDEPTRGLDYHAKRNLTDLLQGWRDEGMAILLVTHDVELAAVIADRVLLMSQGEIIADGPPETVLAASPLFAPQIAHLFPDTGWLTVADVLAAGPDVGQ